MTFREVVYIVSDFCKTISDDSIINTHHILFLTSKYRNYILNQYFSSQKREIGDSNYQTVCIELEKDNSNLEFCGKGNIMRSKNKVPYTLPIGNYFIYPPAGFMYGNIQLVGNQKFKYSGFNKYFKNTIYATIGPDGYLYLKGGENIVYLDKVIITALFVDIQESSKLECDKSGECEICDALDKRFPLDDSYLPALLKYVVLDITGASWKPKDDSNDANDDVARFANLLEKYTTQGFKNKMNAVDPDEDNRRAR